MNEFSPPIFQLAAFPVTPESAAAHALTLAYDPQQKQGMFAYGGAPLRMDYSSVVTRISRGSRNREERATQHMQEQAAIPCVWLGAWLCYGPNWPAELHFTQSAFSYDPATRRWQAQYVRRTIEAVFHDTHYTTIVIDLAVDPAAFRGWYNTTEEYETID